MSDKLQIENVPIPFNTAEEIIDYVGKMVFFNDQLRPIKTIQDALNMVMPEEVIYQYSQELWVVSKLHTVHRWKLLGEFEQGWYKRKVTAENPDWPDETSEKLQITRLGSHFKPGEWEVYMEAFELLQHKHLTNMAHPLPIQLNMN